MLIIGMSLDESERYSSRPPVRTLCHLPEGWRAKEHEKGIAVMYGQEPERTVTVFPTDDPRQLLDRIERAVSQEYQIVDLTPYQENE